MEVTILKPTPLHRAEAGLCEYDKTIVSITTALSPLLVTVRIEGT